MAENERAVRSRTRLRRCLHWATVCGLMIVTFGAVDYELSRKIRDYMPAYEVGEIVAGVFVVTVAEGLRLWFPRLPAGPATQS